MIAIIIGSLLGANNFLYEYLLPLKLAREITDQRTKSFYNRFDVGSVATYAGTVIGASLGFSYLLNTILFANITFIIDRIVQSTTWSAGVFLCILLFLSIAVLGK